jgi:hypothetical protein
MASNIAATAAVNTLAIIALLSMILLVLVLWVFGLGSPSAGFEIPRSELS